MHGAKAFSSILEEARNLRYFYSTNCGLGTLGIREYVDRIGNCRNLEVLSFGKNRLETAGGLILSEAFKHLPNLKAFYCFQNGMDKSATEAIFRELHQHCPNLETLDISDNFVSE
jgi:Ran GTPase-activating protein (RanGAP) involved in mRNA processing and transport